MTRWQRVCNVNFHMLDKPYKIYHAQLIQIQRSQRSVFPVTITLHARTLSLNRTVVIQLTTFRRKSDNIKEQSTSRLQRAFVVIVGDQCFNINAKPCLLINKGF